MKMSLGSNLRSGLFAVLALLGATAALSPHAFAVPAPASEQVVAQVNINTASADQLAEALNGVGLKKAEAIVAYRKANGDFKSIEQLLEVKGIGESTLAKNRARIAL